jgi:hypothetical protein
LKTLFELRTCLHLRNQGHDVEYLAVKDTGRTGPDLVVHGEPDVELECVLVDQDGGRSVPVKKAMEVGVQLLQEMERLGVNRVVFVSTDEKFAAPDTHPLLAVIKLALADQPPQQLTAVNSKYRVTLTGGGSRDAPLSTPEAEQLLRALHKSPVRWGIMNPPSKTIIVPDRYVVRGVSIRSTRGDGAIKHLARAALDKAGQYVSSRPLVIAAGFGMPLMEHQARTELLGLALQQSIGSSLERRPSVSGIAFVFGTGWHAQPVIGGRGVSFDARTAVQAFRNPNATYPLPEDFRWGDAVTPTPISPRA